MFLKTGFSAEIPINHDGIVCIINCVTSVESIQLITIIEAKMGQNGRRLKDVQLFFRVSALS